jgi:hypothetical protein
MKRTIACLALVLAGAQTATGQVLTDYAATCSTLGHLTETALRRNAPTEVLIYIHAAAAIRVHMGDENACHASFFQEVLSKNIDQLSQITALVSASDVRTGKGWSHMLINECVTTYENQRKVDAIDHRRQELLAPSDATTKAPGRTPVPR